MKLRSVKKIKAAFDDFTANITDDEKRNISIARVTYLAFAAIALFMSFINVFSRKYILLTATASFSVLCFIDWILSLKSKKMQKVASFLFAAEIILLFSYFIATGGTDNFSIVWLLLLPTLGLFFFGMKTGTAVCAIVLAIMLAIFHVPGLRDISTDYGKTFTARFPIVYICSYLVSAMLEMIRFYTGKELNILREKFQGLYVHDSLTGLYNRYGLEKTFAAESESEKHKIAISIYDIDCFKNFNDTYGHECGDYVLKELAMVALDTIPQSATLHRWGGEEFLTVYSDPENAFENAELLCDTVRNHDFIYEEKVLHVTISIGIITCDSISPGESYDELISFADSCLYEAKQSGRDRVVSKEYQAA